MQTPHIVIIGGGQAGDLRDDAALQPFEIQQHDAAVGGFERGDQRGA